MQWFPNLKGNEEGQLTVLLIALIVCCFGAWLDEILTMFKSSQQPTPAQCGSIVENLNTINLRYNKVVRWSKLCLGTTCSACQLLL